MRSIPFNFAGFQTYLNDKKLMASRCQNCGSDYLPPKPLCTSCFMDKMEWVELKGEGTLAAFTIVHIAPTAMLEVGYGRENPYCSGIVRLVDGQMISAQILEMNTADPETIQIGTDLEVVFLEREDGENPAIFLAFRPKQPS
jgi:uncharacterized OB-fold protein